MIPSSARSCWRFWKLLFSFSISCLHVAFSTELKNWRLRLNLENTPKKCNYYLMNLWRVMVEVRVSTHWAMEMCSEPEVKSQNLNIWTIHGWVLSFIVLAILLSKTQPLISICLEAGHALHPFWVWWQRQVPGPARHILICRLSDDISRSWSNLRHQPNYGVLPV